ncbi:ATP-binding protein [Streptomyces sp. JJ38]|uniref:ATP-binding protein n=1 Tax=Streptomyces sp. JJ38 TaxID=2738128 RepID=UPI001C57452C|nr:ATP-binding protein [Streptomyces sp. JJ38]MBW1599719.1 ATP-binding protein [Streptomyces sp. JJ38]
MPRAEASALVHRTGQPGYTESLPRVPASAAAARRLVRLALACWRLDVFAEDAALIVTELVANTVQHARRESIRVTVTRLGREAVRIGVVDFSKAPPQRRDTNGTVEDGRGLAVVEHLSAAWGTEPLPWGKRVWAELRGGQ